MREEKSEERRRERVTEKKRKEESERGIEDHEGREEKGEGRKVEENV